MYSKKVRKVTKRKNSTGTSVRLPEDAKTTIAKLAKGSHMNFSQMILLLCDLGIGYLNSMGGEQIKKTWSHSWK